MAAPSASRRRPPDAGEDRALHLRRQDLSAASRAIRWPRRCSPTASIWSAARSNITARAASCRPAPRSRTRWSTIERDAARKTPNVRATVQELYDGLTAQIAEPLAVARLRCRRGQRHRLAVVLGRLLLQDLHVAEGGVEDALRAEDPRGRRPRRRARPARPRPLFVALRALRGAGARRRRGRHRRGARRGRNRRARHPRRRAGRVRRRAALRERRHDRRPGRLGAGRRPRSRSSPRWTMSACCRAPPRSATTRRISSASSSASPTISPIPATTCRASGCGRCAPRRVDPRHRRDRAPHGVRRQRPAGHHAGVGRAHLSQPLRRRGRPECRRLHRQRFSAYAAAIDLKKAGVDIAAIVDLRDNPTGPLVDEARALGIEINHGRAVVTRRRQAARLLA